jgi:hypothetical protein
MYEVQNDGGESSSSRQESRESVALYLRSGPCDAMRSLRARGVLLPKVIVICINIHDL